MGKIRGDVAVLGMANLLQFLSLNKREGVLSIFRGEEKKAIFVTEQGMRLITTTRRKVNTLGEILVRTKKLTRAQLSSLLEEQKTTGRRLGEMVARMGLLSKEDVDAALREQVAEEIYDLFTWSGATFEFAEGRVHNPEAESPLAELILDSNITSLVLEAARRADELERIRRVIPDNKMIPVRLDKDPSLDDPTIDPEVVQALMPLLDGKLPVRDLVENTLFPEFQILRVLYVLTNQGVVKMLDRRGTSVLLQREKESGAGKPAARAATKRTLLVVSDMPTFREALAMNLRTRGYNVVEDETTADFAALVRHVPVDGALLDLSLQTNDGLAVCSRFRGVSSSPFIVLSANTSKETVVQAIMAGAKDYILKPIKDETLFQRLEAALK